MDAVEMNRRIHAKSSDTYMLEQTFREFDLSLQSEQFERDSHLDQLIEKSWGHEYRVFSNNLYDVWKLCLASGQATSLHCHPRKETALLCLAGTGRITTLEGTYTISRQEFIFLGKGVFHSTQNIGEAPLHLVEVELPRNKLDLVRAQDLYGRRGGSYEKQPLRDVCQLRPAGHIEGARIRGTSLENTYHFGLHLGIEVLSWREEGLLFTVGLNLTNALDHTIQIVDHQVQREKMSIHQDDLYLTISQNCKNS